MVGGCHVENQESMCGAGDSAWSTALREVSGESAEASGGAGKVEGKERAGREHKFALNLAGTESKDGPASWNS